MTAVSAEQIKQLRETTGAGMLDCRKALAENNGSMDAAVDWLRKKGLSAAAKKSGRVAAEGVVAALTEGNKGAVIELNAETDFVARNEQFQALATGIVKLAIKGNGDIETLKATSYGNGRNVADEVVQAISVIGENISLRRCATLSVNKGVVASYIHNAVAPGMGKIAILVGLESEADPALLENLGKQLAMHVAAARPEALTTAELDASKVERERAVFREQAQASGKPAEVIEKMIEGRLRKYYEEVVFTEQLYVIDGKTKISQVVDAAAKEMGKPIKVAGFVSYRLGEGIEKAQSDFAAEVAAAAAGA